jgi:hypothetical protein
MKRHMYLGVLGVLAITALLVMTVIPVFANGFTVVPLYSVEKPNKAGTTVPIKIQLIDATGPVSTATVRAIDLTPPSCGVLQSAGKANQNGLFRYDPLMGETGGYIFSLKLAKNAQSGICTVSLSVNDETGYSTTFKVK